jgi:LacI family repressor for deo operon, udp, cdd, tsx, nupC, and nupG
MAADKPRGAADLLAGRRPTMADVARRAQVSTATVSYLLSGRDELARRVGAEAQQRIRVAVGELGYVQNKTARHLRLQRTERIGVLLPRLGIPFADTMAREIDAVARSRGFATVVLAGADAEGFRRAVHEVEGGLADGLIADADGLAADEVTALLAPLLRLGKPCLAVHASGSGRGFSGITHRRLEALQQVLATHVLERGHRRLAYVSNTSGRLNPRLEAVRAFAAATPGFAPVIALEGGQSRELSVARARDIVDLAQRPTLVLVESDFSAVAMIAEFQRLGLDVPADIAIIGFGNAEEGFYCHPRLTTIGPERTSMSEATGHLLDRIVASGDLPVRQFDVPWMLYERGSG